MRAFVVTGTHSGSGKTTVALGLMAAFRERGLAVQPFKTGPDFIDAGLHRLAANRTSRNLDLWMCGTDYVMESFAKHAAGADVAVIEGVMGLYDGDRSTASLAGLLQVPVILVVDAYGMAESAGAMVKGFTEFGVRSLEFGVKFAGVIFNRVASENHYKRLKNSVRDVPVLGYLPRELEFEIPHRHLGLTTVEEDPLADANISRLANAVLRHIDVDATLASARMAASGLERGDRRRSPVRNRRSAINIAVAYDKAFSFYYEDNLDMLCEAGAEIIRFSPLADPAVPAKADAVYLGGGYPELHAGALSENRSMRESIRAFAEAGKPLYAECGGLMYLSRGIRTGNAAAHPMAGVFPFETRMLDRPRLGYREIIITEDCIMGKQGDRCRGHEFHYSEIDGARGEHAPNMVYDVRDGKGASRGKEGYSYKSTLASYVHVHFGSNPRVIDHLTEIIKGEHAA